MTDEHRRQTPPDRGEPRFELELRCAQASRCSPAAACHEDPNQDPEPRNRYAMQPRIGADKAAKSIGAHITLAHEFLRGCEAALQLPQVARKAAAALQLLGQVQLLLQVLARRVVRPA